MGLRRSDNMVGLFASMLASLGGIFTPLHDDAPDPNPKKRRPSGRFSAHASPLGMKGYYVDAHGSLRRIKAKRDKSMSARQWRKQRRAARTGVSA